MMTTARPSCTLIAQIRKAALLACERVAPTWPLDQSIAVNPWWKMRGLPMDQVAAKLQALGGVHLLMPKSYYLEQWQKTIQPAHLRKAANELGVNSSEHALLAFLKGTETDHHWLNVCDFLDADLDYAHKMPWRDEIVQQISQFTALYFQYPEQLQRNDAGENDFYATWLEVVRQDRGIEVLMDEARLSERFAALPGQPEQVLALVHQTLFVDKKLHGVFVDYCYALLLDVHGWASWLAYGAWQDAFANKNDTSLLQLLAIRMAWDWVLWQQNLASNRIKHSFEQQIAQFATLEKNWHAQQQLLWVWQRALEYSYQQPLQSQLLSATAQTQTNLQMQAIFCIDVRSEPIRRALEAQSDKIQTMGFAGFFGLPIEYSVTGSQYQRPQLPGLLKASIRVEQVGSSATQNAAAIQLNGQVAKKQAEDAAAATLGLVEAKGLYRAVSLVKNTFFPSKAAHSINQIDLDGSWQLSRDGKLLTDIELASLAAGILRAMSLSTHFAPIVLLVGHGSSSTNNPHATGLDCGACGGQTGEVNVKVLAQVLNTQSVRKELSLIGIEIPAETQFIAALHNTTTDQITCFGVKEQAAWQQQLLAATEYAQKERALSVGITTQDSIKRARLFERKTRDWAQVRPEWGLANNASFIVAPRSLTRSLNLAGRSFLHDYQWQQDKEFGVLELIMTAPMIVTNWINLQYYASVTDNLKYGSGNKLLHNVVGGNCGVFEGNGGDLRVGLAMQSIHDGQVWRHHPLRLSVYIAAPREAMSKIIAKHQAVADLINNQWLYLLQWDVAQQQIWQYRAGQWQLIESVKELACAL